MVSSPPSSLTNERATAVPRDGVVMRSVQLGERFTIVFRTIDQIGFVRHRLLGLHHAQGTIPGAWLHEPEPCAQRPRPHFACAGTKIDVCRKLSHDRVLASQGPAFHSETRQFPITSTIIRHQARIWFPFLLLNCPRMSAAQREATSRPSRTRSFWDAVIDSASSGEGVSARRGRQV